MRVFVRHRTGGPSPLLALAGASVLGALAVVLLHLDRLPMVLCVFRATTGWPCMTCGTTRALGHLARLDFGAAFTIQPLATLGLLAFFAWGAVDLLLRARGSRLAIETSARETKTAVVLVVIALALNWIYLILRSR